MRNITHRNRCKTSQRHTCYFSSGEHLIRLDLEHLIRLDLGQGEIIRQYKSECECVNSYIAGRTTKAYYQDNKETIKNKVKEYCSNNKDKVQEYKKEYRIKNIEKISQKNEQYKEDNKEAIKEKDKQYRLDHKDAIKERDRQYRLNNEEKLKEYKEKNKVKITCVCGSCFRKVDKNRHEKTHKHQLYLKHIE